MTIQYISVHIDPELLPKQALCIFCNVPMDNIFLEYEFQDGANVIINDEPVPGYHCPTPTCGGNYYDGFVTLALSKAILPLLPSGSEVAGALKQSITAIEKSLR